MPLKGKVGGDFEIAPAGVHKARCYRVIDLGSKQQPSFEDKEILTWVHKIMILFELPETEMKKDGDAFSIGAFYTLSMHKKSSLRPFLESWRGKNFTNEEAEEFDIAKLVNATATIQVIHDDEYANIKTIMPLASKDCPDAVNEQYSLCLNRDDFDQETFDKLSDKLKERIKMSPEYRAVFEEVEPMGDPDPVVNTNEEEIPF